VPLRLGRAEPTSSRVSVSSSARMAIGCNSRPPCRQLLMARCERFSRGRKRLYLTRLSSARFHRRTPQQVVSPAARRGRDPASEGGCCVLTARACGDPAARRRRPRGFGHPGACAFSRRCRPARPFTLRSARTSSAPTAVTCHRRHRQRMSGA
jgi:hypothetical protein